MRISKLHPSGILLLIVIMALLLPAPVVYAQDPAKTPQLKRIFKKMDSDQELTPEEEKALGEYMMGEKMVTPPGVETKKEKKKIQSLSPVPPTRQEYITLVKEISKSYGSKAGQVISSLDSVLASAKKDSDGSDLAGVFFITGRGSAAAYSASWSAIRNPDDALTANNLGVTLNGMEDYQRALRVLLYADVLSPNTPLFIVNIAWTYYNAGDIDKAKELFEKAGRLSPELSAAKLGLGLIAERQGNPVAASSLLRQSLSEMYSAEGAAGLQRAGASIKEQDGERSAPEPVAREKDEAEKPVIPDPPVSEDIGSNVGILQPLTSLHLELADRLRLLTEEGIRNRQAEQETVFGCREEVGAGNILINRGFEKESFLFEDITRLLLEDEGGPMGKAQMELDKALDGYSRENDNFAYISARHMKELVACRGDRHCQEQKQYEFCLKAKPSFEYQHMTLYKGYKSYWDAYKRTAEDYYAFTNPVLKDVYCPGLNKLFNLEREKRVLERMHIALTTAEQFPVISTAYLSLGKCVQPEPPEEPGPASIPEIKEKKGKCSAETVKYDLSIGSLEINNCGKVKIEGGMVLIGYAEFDLKNNQGTVFIGAGGNVGFIGGKAGVYATFTSTEAGGTTISDTGVEGSFSTKYLDTNESGKATVKEWEATGRIGMASGPKGSAETKGWWR